MSNVGLDAILANQAKNDTSATTPKTNALGKEAFFNLLIKQLQYQDPLNPVENTEFTGQLAQFTTLETLSNIDKNMSQFSSLQTSINNIQTLSFIGKHVSAQGNVIRYNGNPVNVNFGLDARAAEVTVRIYTEDGTVVRSATMKNLTEGKKEWNWDGRNDEGNTLSSGRYNFVVSAVDYEGKRVGTTSYATGEVTGVRYDNGMTYLLIGDKEVAVSDIEKIER